VRDAVRDRVEAVNATVSRFEQVHGFVLADHEFSIETGELTPTLKTKRREVIERHRPALDALYDRV